MPGPKLPAVVYHPNGTRTNIKYAPTFQDNEMMGIAIDQAREAFEAGDNPIGCVYVTPEGKYPAQTREFRDNNLEAHAEKLGYSMIQGAVGRDLSGSILYTTAEPCYGCAYMLDKGNIGMLFIAADKKDAPGFFRNPDTLDKIWSGSRRQLTVVRGLRKVEAIELLTAESKRH